LRLSFRRWITARLAPNFSWPATIICFYGKTDAIIGYKGSNAIGNVQKINKLIVSASIALVIKQQQIHYAVLVTKGQVHEVKAKGANKCLFVCLVT
jgi:hypothetical protein